jgi:GNAT superfamily N-acetyltransferase
VAIEVRTVSGYDQLERWTATRNVPGPEVFTTELAALVRATELDRVDLLALEDGDPVGMGFLSADPVSRETGRAFVQVKVPEEHRGRGVGSALLAAVSNHARRLGVSALRCSAREDDAYSVAFLERRGFEVWWRMPELALVLDSGERTERLVPAGVEVAWLADRGDAPLAGMYEIARATYPDCPGMRAGYARSENEWRLYDLADPQVRLDLTAVAYAGDDVVGYSILEDVPDQPFLHHGMVAVAQEWRGRGVGSSVLRTQAEAARALGLRELVAIALVEPIQRLYERCGYQPREHWLGFEGPLLAG